MLGLILLLTAPLVLGGVLLNNWLDDDDDEAAAGSDDTSRAEDTPITDGDVYLENTGEGVLTGRDGVDIYFLNAAENNEGIPGEINLRAGSDIAEISTTRDGFFGVENLVLRGGEGDDRLSNDALNATTRGGPGNDQIEAFDNSSTFGGDGDDQIFVDVFETRAGSAPTFIDGGNGDDEITVVDSFSTIADIDGIIEITGGQGTDSFVLDTRNADFALLGDGIDAGGTTQLFPIATITDFERGVDQLTVKYEATSPDVDFAVEPFVALDGEEGVRVSFTTGGNAIEPAVKGSVIVFGAPDLTVDDVTFERTGGLIVEDGPVRSVQITDTGAVRIEGTDGPDVFVTDASFGFERPTEVYDLGGGDDIARINDEGAQINLGDGDDFLRLDDYSDVSAGAGDDTVVLDLGLGVDRFSTQIDGGPGDDRIEVKTIFGFDNEDIGGGSRIFVDGGEGADDLAITASVVANNIFDLDQQNTFGVIRNFDPAEDVLTLNTGVVASEDGLSFSISAVQQDDGQFSHTLVTTVERVGLDTVFYETVIVSDVDLSAPAFAQNPDLIGPDGSLIRLTTL